MLIETVTANGDCLTGRVVAPDEIKTTYDLRQVVACRKGEIVVVRRDAGDDAPRYGTGFRFITWSDVRAIEEVSPDA